MGYFLFLCSLLATTFLSWALSAGSSQSIIHRDYAPILSINESTTSPEKQRETVFFDLGSVITAKERVLAEKIDDDQKIKRIVELYRYAKNFLQTPDDYILLLRPDENMVVYNANEEFLLLDLDRFFKANPRILQVNKLLPFTYQISTAMKIKSYGLRLVEKPEDFLELVKLQVEGEPTVLYRRLVTEFIRLNLDAFKNTKPSLENVLALLAHVLNIREKPEAGLFGKWGEKNYLTETEKALLKIKYEFSDTFSGADLDYLLKYGCKNLSKDYEDRLDQLKNELGV